MSSYTIIKKHGIKPRAEDAAWDENVPGLYTSARSGAPCPETVVGLDTGQTVALSIEADYRENDLAVHLCGWARSIEADGSSCESPDKVPVETTCSVGVSRDQMDLHGLPAFKSEVLKALLGEAPTLVSGVPLMWISDANRQSASIRNAIASLTAISADSDISSLL